MSGVVDKDLRHEKSNISDRNSSEADSSEAMRKIRNAGRISISPELFEQLYFASPPKTKNIKFGNPGPIAICGFIISLTPLACDLMGWRGAGNHGIASIGTYYFFGGFLMTLGGIGEWILGNTFSFVVYCSYGAFWLALGATLQPAFNAYGAYSQTSNPFDGLATPGFNSSFGFFCLAMSLLSLVYLVCSLRTNVVLVAIFFTLLMYFLMLTACFWQIANGQTELAGKLQVAAGAFGLASVAVGWYDFVAVLMEDLDFPIKFPMGDLSRMIKPMSEKNKTGSGVV